MKKKLEAENESNKPRGGSAVGAPRAKEKSAFFFSLFTIALLLFFVLFSKIRAVLSSLLFLFQEAFP